MTMATNNIINLGKSERNQVDIQTSLIISFNLQSKKFYEKRLVAINFE